MSKDTPEVGDVWEHNMGGIKINIKRRLEKCLEISIKGKTR